MVPLTSNLYAGLDVPTPRFPTLSIMSLVVAAPDTPCPRSPIEKEPLFAPEEVIARTKVLLGVV